MAEKNDNEKVLNALDKHDEDYDRWGHTPGAIKFFDPDEPEEKNEKEE